jgi:hypothetical protein
VTLFDSVEQRPPSKWRRYLITGLVAVILAGIGLFIVLRFHKERVTIFHFMNAVVAGNMQQAYQIWKPSESYTFKRFLEDWGPNGYYAPIKSYQIKPWSAQHISGGRTIAIKVELSPYQPFPDENDMLKQSKTQEITLWVQSDDQSISFPPE